MPPKPKRDNSNKHDNEDGHICLSQEGLKNLITEVINRELGKLLLKIDDLKTEIEQLRNNQVNSENPPGEGNITNLSSDNVHSILNSSLETVIDTGKKPKKKKTEKVPKEIEGTYVDAVYNTRPSSSVLQSERAQREAHIVGSNTNTSELTFGAPEGRLWLYVGRCRSDTSEEHIVTYVNNKCQEDVIVTSDVFKLPSKGKNASFRLSLDMKLREQVYNPSFWPVNVVVKRFKFFRKSGCFSESEKL